MSAAIFSLMCWALPTSYGEAVFKVPGPMDELMLSDPDSAAPSVPDGESGTQHDSQEAAAAANAASDSDSDSSSSSDSSASATTLILGHGRARSRSRSRNGD